jgi:Domain of unknown function (DUF4136)
MIAASTLPWIPSCRHRVLAQAQPDFLIAYFVTTRQGLDIQDNRLGIGPWERSGNITVNQVTEGALVVVFVDRAMRQEVWRGYDGRAEHQRGHRKRQTSQAETRSDLPTRLEGTEKG